MELQGRTQPLKRAVLASARKRTVWVWVVANLPTPQKLLSVLSGLLQAEQGQKFGRRCQSILCRVNSKLKTNISCQLLCTKVRLKTSRLVVFSRYGTARCFCRVSTCAFFICWFPSLECQPCPFKHRHYSREERGKG